MWLKFSTHDMYSTLLKGLQLCVTQSNERYWLTGINEFLTIFSAPPTLLGQNLIRNISTKVYWTTMNFMNFGEVDAVLHVRAWMLFLPTRPYIFCWFSHNSMRICTRQYAWKLQFREYRHSGSSTMHSSINEFSPIFCIPLPPSQFGWSWV
jgi:hypothetical protein